MQLYKTINNECSSSLFSTNAYPDNKVHGANMGPTWVLSAPDGSHVIPMNLAIIVLSDTWKPSTPKPTQNATTFQDPTDTAVCALKASRGDHDCHHWRKIWVYNQFSSTCRVISYSGCGGTDNKFHTREACMDLCVHRNTSEFNILLWTVTVLGFH